ncbi:hypothetical protein ACHAXH_001712 [Discostella pseudostelligera]
MMESTLVPNNNTTTDNPLFGDDNDEHGNRNNNPLFGSLDAVEDIDIAANNTAPSQSMTAATTPAAAAAISSSAYNNGGNTSSPALAPATTTITTTSTTKASRVNDLMGQLLLGDNDINGTNGDDDDVAQEIIIAEEVEDPLFAPMSPSELAPTTTTTSTSTTTATTTTLHPSSMQTASTTASIMSSTTAPPVVSTTTTTTKLLAESGLLDAIVPSSSSMPALSDGGGGGGREGTAALFEDDANVVGTNGGVSGSLFHDNIIVGNNTGLFDEVDAATEQYHPTSTTTDEANTQQEGNNSNGDGGGQQYGGYDFGMGMMGVGGEIPKSPHPPANYQYSQYHPTGPHHHQQQQQYQHQYPNYSTLSHPQQQQHHQNQVGGVMNAMAGSYYYSTTGAGQMTQRGAPTPSTPTIATSSSSPMISPQPSILAGMHVGHDVNLGGVAPPSSSTATAASNFSDRHHRLDGELPMANYYIPPEPFEPHYGKVVVGDPMLIQGSGLFAGPPHWTYLVTVYAKNSRNNTNIQQQQQQQQQQSQPISAVRRRFRHFVALEDRLRQSVPGAILPPRPDKHPTRAIEEASGRQSMDFARQRASELSVYMNALVQHPYAGPSPDLRLFLMLQDHIGTAWPEVSPSALTRIAAAGTATVERLADVVDGALGELGAAQQVAAGEDSAEILALAAREGRRIGAVSSSVPKVEGAVALICDRGDKLGSTGMELSKLVKDVTWCDRDLTGPLEILAGAMLRSGRRTRRLGLEVGDAITPFVVQYRMCKYEQMAFADRRLALRRRTEARTRADQRAAKLMMNQTSMQSYGRLGTLERMETEAAMYDELAMEASKEADEVAIRLQAEVGRIGTIRVEEWEKSMKGIASGMREGYAENASIWESALEAFRREFPDVS